MTDQPFPPSNEQWVQENAAVFAELRDYVRGESAAPLKSALTIYTDFDETKRAKEVGVKRAFGELNELVGDLNIAKLKLDANIDGSWFVTLEPHVPAP